MKRSNVTVKGNLDSQECMIFGHGFGTDQSTWDLITGPFEKDFRIVLYDLVGSGNSDLNAYNAIKYDNLEAFSVDLIALCYELNLHQCVFVGHSVSCMAGMLASFEEPTLFKKMIFIGASPRYLNDVNYNGGLTLDELDALYHQMGRNYYEWVNGFAPYVMQNADRPELVKRFAETLSAVRPDIAESMVKTIFQSDYRRYVGRIQMPVLLLNSVDDPAVPIDVAHFLHSKIPQSTLVEMHTTGHFPQMSDPDEIIHQIQLFLTETGS